MNKVTLLKNKEGNISLLTKLLKVFILLGKL